MRSSERVYGLSDPIGFANADSFAEFQNGRRIYLSCGDSGETDLQPKVVDAIVTDPPFFDNVHYSELADFFYVWQRHIVGDAQMRGSTTRSRKEVQSCEEEKFTSRLTKIWSECCRVLKDDGLLVFTYHHSRATGWRSILRALLDAGFAVVAAHPIKAEMSVATPKHQAKEPIDIDVVIVCRKKIWVREHNSNSHVWDDDRAVATQQICRLRAAGRKLSRNDIQVIIMGQLLRSLSERSTSAAAIDDLDCSKSMIDDFVESLWCAK